MRLRQIYEKFSKDYYEWKDTKDKLENETLSNVLPFNLPLQHLEGVSFSDGQIELIYHNKNTIEVSGTIQRYGTYAQFQEICHRQRGWLDVYSRHMNKIITIDYVTFKCADILGVQSCGNKITVLCTNGRTVVFNI